MRDFIQAFGGMVGVALIVIVVAAVALGLDWLRVKLGERRRGGAKDGTPR